MTVPFVKHFIFEIDFISQRSGGPGGQNVNKTNSSVQLRWDFHQSQILSEDQKTLIQKKLSNMINSDGTLYIRSELHRDFEKNKKDALEKLQAHLTKAFFKPKPRKATKPTRGSKERRIAGKKIKSDIKKARQTKWT